jgi:hypothetical protein
MSSSSIWSVWGRSHAESTKSNPGLGPVTRSAVIKDDDGDNDDEPTVKGADALSSLSLGCRTSK